MSRKTHGLVEHRHHMGKLFAELKELIERKGDFSMDTSEAEMTFEERNHLYHLVGAVWLVCLFSFLTPMLFYIKPPEPLPQGTWDFFIWYGIPLSILQAVSWWLPYEVFYPKRIRKSRGFHVKRFARRTLSMIAGIVSFFGITALSGLTFSKTLGDDAIFPGILLFLLVAVIATFLWLRRHRIQW
jgi:hypothetical protein